MAEWKEYELNQICSRLSSGKGLPAKKISDSGKYPVYGGNGLRGYTETANFEGDYPTLIVRNIDQPGHVMEVTAMLGHKGVNIATLQLFRQSRGGQAAMVIECDQEVPAESIKWLSRQEGIVKVTYLSQAQRED